MARRRPPRRLEPQKARVGPGRPRARERAVNGRRGERGAQQLALEPLLQPVDQAHGHDAQDLQHVGASQTPGGQADPEEVQKARAAVTERSIDRQLAEQLVDEGPDTREEIAVLGVPPGVAVRERGDLRCRGDRIVVQQQPGPVGLRDEHRGRGCRQRKAVLHQLQPFHDVASDTARIVQQPGGPVPRMKLLTGGQSADEVAPLQHQDPAAFLGKQRSRRQAVVTRSDHDDVVARHRYTAPDPSMVLAASSPGPPITPPPGCVPDAHIQRSRTGVRYRLHPETGR